jgi:hypothetical protein
LALFFSSFFLLSTKKKNTHSFFLKTSKPSKTKKNSVGDWEGGFVPPGAPDPVEAGLAPALGAVLEQLSSGGGAKGVDVAAIQGEIEILSSKLALQIPSYFALILRTFSLIEGIALKVKMFFI